MTDKTYTVGDMVGFAAGSNAAEFQSAFNQIMQQRAAEAIDSARQVVAGSLVGDEPVEVEDPEEVTDDDKTEE